MNYKEFLEIILFLALCADAGLFLLSKKYKKELGEEIERSCKLQLRAQELRVKLMVNKKNK